MSRSTGFQSKVPVVALVGAGASHVSGSFEVRERPPLTTQLFKTPRAVALLRTYALAQDAGFVIDDAMTADTSMAFEEALASLAAETAPHRQQMAMAVPPFLQALLLEYSFALSTESRRYSRLVDELLRLQTQVHFVSLNYDTLLDQRLANYTPLNTLSDYLDTEYGWSLIKPHGSVAWFRRQEAFFDPTRFEPGFKSQATAIQACAVRDLLLADVRGTTNLDWPHTETQRYPALALPMGEKDELVLPPTHLEAFQELLAGSKLIDLLVLGYSGVDTEVLDLIKEAPCQIRRLTIVNASSEAALAVFDRIDAFGIQGAIWPDVFDGTYEQWIDGIGLRNWAREFDGAGRFPSLSEPEQLRVKVLLGKPKPVSQRLTAGIRDREV